MDEWITHLEYVPHLIVSGGIQAYVPAADIRVVLYTSLARPKSVIFSVLFRRWSPSMASLIKTERNRIEMISILVRLFYN